VENVAFVAAAVAILVVVVALVVRGRRGRAPARSRPRPSSQAPTRPSDAPAFRGEGLGAKVRAALGRNAGRGAWRELEDLLIRADVGPIAAADLVTRVRSRFGTGDDPADLLREEIVSVLGDADGALRLPGDRLGVVLVVGVNGSGKTTTIGKLARRFASEGKTVSIAASDTFRAAAGEQLEVWAERAGAHLVAQQRGADPGAVAFDAVRSALAKGSDVLIVDTAGRLHTKQPLMDELEKVRRVIEKAGGTVDETLLVLDAQTGQNGVAQAKAFTEAVDVTGIVLTKADGTAKGGIVLAVREELGAPVRYLGVGEGLDDLRPFRAEPFVERLLEG
jgi:fused signal recognition particle receptor